VFVAVPVSVNVGRGVRVGDGVRVGVRVRVGVAVSVKFGLRVEVGVRVNVGLEVDVTEGVTVAVVVSVGRLDEAEVASWAFSVPEARVARELRFGVGEGFLGVAVTTRVNVGEGANVGATVADSVGA